MKASHIHGLFLSRFLKQNKFYQNIDEYVRIAFNLTETTTSDLNDVVGRDEEENEDFADMVDPDQQLEEETLPPREDLDREDLEERTFEQEGEEMNPFINDPSTTKKPFISWSYTWFRIAILILCLAVLLAVSLPFYEKRYKSYMRNKRGNTIHPTVIGLQADIESLKNKQRLLREDIRTLNYQMDDIENK